MSQYSSAQGTALQPSELVASFLTAAPVPVMQIAIALGLRVQSAVLGEISGKIERDGPGYLITINGTDSAVRQRFTLAHEIGHYVLHRDLIGDGIEDDAMYRSRLGGFYETQANQYAAYILMPPGLFRARFSSIQQAIGAPQAILYNIAGEFGVSQQAAEFRAKNLGLM